MKKFIFVALALVSICVFADDTSTTNTKPRRKLDRQKMMQNWYKRTGGRISVPNAKQGKIVFVNAQSKAKNEWIKEIVDKFAASHQLDIFLEQGDFTFPEPKIIGNATLFIVDDLTLPNILHAPENRWTMVNVANLQSGNGTKPQFFEARVKKELTRGFCLLAGTQTSNYPDSLLTTITKPEDLDKFPSWELPVDIPERFVPYLAGFGVKPDVFTTYKKACIEGWAPAPTNEIQQAILESVKDEKERGPVNALKITPPQK